MYGVISIVTRHLLNHPGTDSIYEMYHNLGILWLPSVIQMAYLKSKYDGSPLKAVFKTRWSSQSNGLGMKLLETDTVY